MEDQLINMAEQGENNREEMVEGESRIDYHIRTTRKAMHPDALFARYPVKDVKSYSVAEFSGGRGPIGRLYAWLLLKLTSLYLAKGFMWLVRLIKRK